MLAQMKVRKDAKRLGEDFYFTGKPCMYGHISKRRTDDGKCNQCEKEKYQSNRKIVIERSAKWANENRQRRREIALDWARNNPEINSRWNRENPDKRREVARNWVKNNLDYVNANTVIYRLEKLNACPSWININEIHQIYIDCPNDHHVDHIVPIKGITPEGYRVSGLHVHWNLQYLTQTENTSKGNRMTQRCYEIACSLRKKIK